MKIEEPLAETLTVSPNSDQTALEYWESQEAQKLLHGNSYAEKLFIGDQLVGFVSAVDTVDFRNVSAPTDCTDKVGEKVRKRWKSRKNSNLELFRIF